MWLVCDVLCEIVCCFCCVCCVCVYVCRCVPGVDVFVCAVRDVWGDVAWLELFYMRAWLCVFVCFSLNRCVCLFDMYCAMLYELCLCVRCVCGCCVRFVLYVVCSLLLVNYCVMLYELVLCV